MTCAAIDRLAFVVLGCILALLPGLLPFLYIYRRSSQSHPSTPDEGDQEFSTPPSGTPALGSNAEHERRFMCRDTLSSNRQNSIKVSAEQFRRDKQREWRQKRTERRNAICMQSSASSDLTSNVASGTYRSAPAARETGHVLRHEGLAPREKRSAQGVHTLANTPARVAIAPHALSNLPPPPPLAFTTRAVRSLREREEFDSRRFENGHKEQSYCCEDTALQPPDGMNLAPGSYPLPSALQVQHAQIESLRKENCHLKSEVEELIDQIEIKDELIQHLERKVSSLEKECAALKDEYPDVGKERECQWSRDAKKVREASAVPISEEGRTSLAISEIPGSSASSTSFDNEVDDQGSAELQKEKGDTTPESLASSYKEVPPLSEALNAVNDESGIPNGPAKMKPLVRPLSLTEEQFRTKLEEIEKDMKWAYST